MFCFVAHRQQPITRLLYLFLPDPCVTPVDIEPEKFASVRLTSSVRLNDVGGTSREPSEDVAEVVAANVDVDPACPVPEVLALTLTAMAMVPVSLNPTLTVH